MVSKWLRRLGLAALVGGVAWGSVGCATERDPINRVQSNAVPKSFFVGEKFDDPSDDPEFYARTMVIDVPYGESGSDFLMFTNTINSVSRIKWNFAEDGQFLEGRLAFERIEGTDGKGLEVKQPNDGRTTAGGYKQNDGIVVYKFRVQSHFDIRRAYNSQTGEETNVVEENTSDRPWYERQYVRVDWAENLVTTAYDFDTMSLLGVYNGIKYSPIAHGNDNPNTENAPVYDVDNGYFDVTNKVFAEPQNLKVWGMEFPGCLLPNVIRGGTEPAGNCNPNEITLRHSFKRVVDHDYEAADWDGKRFETYGAFFKDRNGYQRQYGLVDKNWRRFIQRYNIWERSHFYADPEKMTGSVSCSTDNDCNQVADLIGEQTGEKVLGSKCDTFRSQCTLPYRLRKAKPIVWHYADKNAQQYYDASLEATIEWDTAMREAVTVARYAECMRYSPRENCVEQAGGSIIDGNFADEEDAMFLVKEIEACRRGEVDGFAGEECNTLADELATKRGYSKSVAALAKMPSMVMLCHSPVSDKDPKECGRPGTVARLGDLRYSLITNVATPQTNSPWGIMSDASDPITGEKVAASVNVWTHVNDLFAQGLVDTLRYIGGELKTENITDGTYVNNWVEAAKKMGQGQIFPRLTEDQVDDRIAAVAGTDRATLRKAHAAVMAAKSPMKSANKPLSADNAKLVKSLQEVLRRVEKTKASIDAPSHNAPIYEARRQLGAGTPMEAAVTTPAMQQLALSGFGDLAANAKGDKLAAASIFQGLNPQFRRELIQRREAGLAARGVCIMNFEAETPLGYVALSDVLQQKFGKFNPADKLEVQSQRAEKMADFIRRRAQYAVISHEMGHSFALRHNFVSSSDAWGFRPQYWQLRTNDKELSAKACPASGSPTGEDCSGPRWLDPVTANESRNIIQMWMQSSTMEYAGEPTQDFLGLGSYDFGAARMFYGDAVAVYKDPRFNANQTPGAYAAAHQNEFGGLLGISFRDGGQEEKHYSEIDGVVNLIESCKPVTAASFKPVNWNEEKDGAWSPLLDGHLVTNKAGATTRCTQPKVDYVQWGAMKESGDHPASIDAAGRVRVPQGFASDEWADLGNVSVFRHDNGADLYEVMHFWIAQAEANHIFTNYRRGKRDFSIWGAFNRALGRYHEKMRDSAKAIGLYITLARDTGAIYGAADDPAGFVAEVLKANAAPNTVASAIAFDHFSRVFSRPQAGEHGRLGGLNDNVYYSCDGTGFARCGAELLIANGVTGTFGNISIGGRPIENALARTQGRDYDRDYTLNVGSYYEKAFTAMLLTESADNFISSSRDDFVDPRFRSVSIADVFPDGVRRWLANNLTNDEQVKGVRALPKAAGGPDLDQGFATIGTTSWWPKAGIQSCFPQGNAISCGDPTNQGPLENPPGGAVVIAPEVGWEQQKFAALFTLLYLPENQQQNWLNQMRIWEIGEEGDPGIENRIEFHDPSGKVYVARTYGTEVLFGKTVQKGIAARVLEWANELLNNTYVTTAVVKNGTTWYIPTLDAGGKPTFKFDPQRRPAAPTSCEESKDCVRLQYYTSMPQFLREAQAWLGFTRIGGLRGVY